MRIAFASLLALALVGCDGAEIQETAETFDGLIPKLIPDDIPTSISGTSPDGQPITLSAVFVPGAWANNEVPPDRGIAWSRSPKDDLGWPGRKYTPVSQCEPAGGDYPANAERCSVTIEADRSATYYLEWRYVPAPPSTDPGFVYPEDETATIAVTLPDPPTPPAPQDAAFSDLSVTDPICADSGGTDVVISYAFDLNDTQINGNNAYCVTLAAGGNVIGGMPHKCWGSNDDSPTSGSKLVELNAHFGGFGELPESIEFEAFLHQQLTPISNSLDKISVTREVGICQG